ncbi:MAG: DMT family transporter [Caldilineaceae bacterium]
MSHYKWGRWGWSVRSFSFVLATRKTTAANAIFIQYTAPIYVALFWHLVFAGAGHPYRLADDGGRIVVGMFSFFRRLCHRWLFEGNFYAFLSSISFAAFMFCMRKQKDGSAVESVLLGSLLSALVGAAVSVSRAAHGAEWGGLLFMGVVQTGIPFVMLALAIRQITAVESILIQTLEPILNPVWVFMVVGDSHAGGGGRRRHCGGGGGFQALGGTGAARIGRRGLYRCSCDIT